MGRPINFDEERYDQDAGGFVTFAGLPQHFRHEDPGFQRFKHVHIGKSYFWNHHYYNHCNHKNYFNLLDDLKYLSQLEAFPTPRSGTI